MPIPMTCAYCGKRLTVPDSAVGKRAQCPACKSIMTIPPPVQDAEEIGAEEVPAGPPAAASGDPLDFLRSDAGAAAPSGPAEEGRRPCPMCGEMIVANAAKCRFCGAVLDPTLRKELRRKEQDADLTTGDWIFCILCAGIACIFGIVYAIQGKPKGMKMVGVSIAAAVIWNILNAILQLAIHEGRPGPGFR